MEQQPDLVFQIKLADIILTDTAETAEFVFLKMYSFCTFLQKTDKGIADEDKNEKGGMGNRQVVLQKVEKCIKHCFTFQSYAEQSQCYYFERNAMHSVLLKIKFLFHFYKLKVI